MKQLNMDINTGHSMEKQILETAEQLFLEKGFALTSTTEIAKAAGCNQALVHYYFRTKENLFKVIFENKFADFFQSVFDRNNLDNKTFQEKLKFIIESHYDMLIRNPKMPALILRELSRQPDQIKTIKDKLKTIPAQLFSELSADLEAEIKKGTIRRDVTLLDLVLSMVSLNMALFLMMPIIEKALDFTDQQMAQLISHRRNQNVEFILNSIRPA